MGRRWAQAPASPFRSAGYVRSERPPVPSVEPSDLGPEVACPRAPTSRPAACCWPVRSDAARVNVIVTHGGSPRPVGGVSSAAMDDVEGTVSAADTTQPRRTKTAISLTMKKPSAATMATALLTAILSPSTTLNHLSFRSSRHEWTIAIVVMSIMVQPGVGPHTPTTSGAEVTGDVVQVRVAGEAVDGNMAALCAATCVRSSFACL